MIGDLVARVEATFLNLKVIGAGREYMSQTSLAYGVFMHFSVSELQKGGIEN